MDRDKERIFKGRKNRGKQYSFLFRFVLKTAAIAGITVICFTFVLQFHRATGNTMSPFVRDGDLCVFYKLEKPYLNDVVLYHEDKGKLRIGRIVATGGQTIAFQEEGGYTVDAYTPTEEVPYETYYSEKSNVEFPMELAEDEVFIMNDFRSITDDGREMGPVKRDRIEGKLFFMLRRRYF